MGSHALDYLDHLLGPIVKVEGQASNFAGLYAPEDTICGSFTFASGCLGTGAWSFACGVSEDRLEVIGSEGSVSLSVFGVEPPVVRAGGEETLISAETPEHIQQPLVETIVRELQGLGACPSTGESAARTNHVLDCLVSG
jgi:predicted dehydrogenase